jgi:hypothetical protein
MPGESEKEQDTTEDDLLVGNDLEFPTCKMHTPMKTKIIKINKKTLTIVVSWGGSNFIHAMRSIYK